ncbi:hypothetical protein ACA910_000480 [Epithemia clementina (nom. ined.)]
MSPKSGRTEWKCIQSSKATSNLSSLELPGSSVVLRNIFKDRACSRGDSRGSRSWTQPVSSRTTRERSSSLFCLLERLDSQDVICLLDHPSSSPMMEGAFLL